MEDLFRLEMKTNLCLVVRFRPDLLLLGLSSNKTQFVGFLEGLLGY